VTTTPAWERNFDRWLQPFLAVWGDKRRLKWAPLYLRGLLLPGDRKSIAPIASRVAPEDEAQLHHFVADSPWDTAPLEEVLLQRVDALLGGANAHLIVDDTALPKKGEHSVGVAHQYCGALGKQANCQVLVSLTLARNEIPAPIALRLFLTQPWAQDAERRKRAKVPESIVYRPKWKIALEEIDRVLATGVSFGDVLADAGYGACAEFRRGLSDRNLQWAVGILSTQNVYSSDVTTRFPKRGVGQPRKHPVVSEAPVSASRYIETHGRFRKVGWREGTKGKLEGEFAVVRVCPADGTEASMGVHLPGDAAWLVCERFSNGDRKYYLCSFPASASIRSVVAAVKARWACEQAHQQMKEELGLDHFEARSWVGIHHHAVLVMIAFAFLTHVRLHENKSSTQRALAPSNASGCTSGVGSAPGCVDSLR
jgi:SRSO17 transposase